MPPFPESALPNVVMNIFISFFAAVSIGTTALVSRNYGKKDLIQTAHCMSQSILLGILLGIGVGLFSLLFHEPILRLSGADHFELCKAVLFNRGKRFVKGAFSLKHHALILEAACYKWMQPTFLLISEVQTWTGSFACKMSSKIPLSFRLRSSFKEAPVQLFVGHRDLLLDFSGILVHNSHFQGPCF